MKKRSIQKGQIIQHKGDLYTKTYYVESGLLRSYIIDSKGKEHVYMFSPEGWYCGDSSPPDEPCDLFVDALEPSIIYEMEKGEVLKNHDKMVLIKRIASMQKRMLMLMSTPLIDRYDYFLETYPKLSQRVSQKMIASFLGSTPEALSKVKAEKWKER
ncbi:MAG: Crp/Fnr family transcriptional regulator [Cyclobacteriaceae bacterium]|nr:Crp/Fnr family transcriptional regulator [Cyclobacteriaceae bacterium HetDA_MAG_MS6]